MVRVIRAKSVVLLALVALVLPFATRAAPLEPTESVVELSDGKELPADKEVVTLVPATSEEAATDDDDELVQVVPTTSEEATTSDDDQTTEKASDEEEDEDTERVRRGWGGYGRSGLDLDLGYGSGYGLERGLGYGRGLSYGGYGVGRGLSYGGYGLGRGLGYGGYGLGGGLGRGLGLGVDTGLVTGGLAITGPIRVPAHTGGTGRTTLLKSVRSTVVPTYRTGVTYVPQRYHVTGRKDITVPYYRRVTTTLRNLGPGNAHVRKVQTGVRHEGVSGGRAALNRVVGVATAPTVAVKGLGGYGVGRVGTVGLGRVGGYGVRRVGGYGVGRVNAW